MVVLGGGAVSYERGTPVGFQVGLSCWSRFTDAALRQGGVG